MRFPGPVLVSLVLISVAFAQPKTVDITGTVLNQSTGASISRALVTLTAQPPVTAFSDATGTFHFAVPPGNYSLSVSKPQMENAFLPVNASAASQQVELRLNPLSVVSGTVTDTDGNPLRGVNIVLLQAKIVGGFRQISQLRSVATDDLGQYRLWNLGAGTYLLRATGRSGGTALYTSEKLPTFSAAECFSPVYHGGGADERTASPLVLTGQATTADFRLAMHPARRIRGTLTGMTPFRFAHFELTDATGNIVSSRAALSGAGGKFELLDVPPGTYSLGVKQGDTGSEVYGRVPVNVTAEDAEDVAIALQPGATFHVKPLCPEKTAGNQSEPKLPAIQRLMCAGLNLRLAGQPVDRESIGTFKNLAPGDYEFSVQNIGPNSVTSVQVGGRILRPGEKLSVTAGMPDVELAIASNTGTVAVQFNNSLKGFFWLLAVPLFESYTGPVEFPVGPFSPFPLPPGDYTLYAFDRVSLQNLEYHNPEALRALTGGISLRVEANGKHRVEIRSLSK